MKIEQAEKPVTRNNRNDLSPKVQELKVSYQRRNNKKHRSQSERQVLATPGDCYGYLKRIWNADTISLREEFVLVCLDTSLAVNGWFRLSAGSMDSCPIDARLLFGIALKTASNTIVIAHNHPTGNLVPSEEDRLITKRIAAGARLLNIRLLDHFIVSDRGFYSFREGNPDLFDTDYLLNQLRWA